MGNCRIYSIPGKTVALDPEFVVEDLTSAELQPRFLRFSEGPALGQNTHDDGKKGERVAINHCEILLLLIYFRNIRPNRSRKMK